MTPLQCIRILRLCNSLSEIGRQVLIKRLSINELFYLKNLFKTLQLNVVSSTFSITVACLLMTIIIIIIVILDCPCKIIWYCRLKKKIILKKEIKKYSILSFQTYVVRFCVWLLIVIRCAISNGKDGHQHRKNKLEE